MESAPTLIPAGIAAAGAAASIAQQAGLFGGNKTPSTPKVAPPPTRDTAADAIAATQAEEQKRRGWQTGSSSTQLTPAGGVPNEYTGTRMLTPASQLLKGLNL